MSAPFEPDEVPILRRVVLYAIALFLLVGTMLWTLQTARDAYNRLFPEAGARTPERLVLCGRIGKYRLYCGVGDDFTGPTEDPVRQWK